MLLPIASSRCVTIQQLMLDGEHASSIDLECSPLSCSLPFLAVAAFPIVGRQGDAQLAGSNDGGG